MASKRKTKKKVGRPTKLTPKIQAEIIELIKAGNYIETACNMVGLHKSTYYDWQSKAKQSSRANKYTMFSDAIKKAQAFSEARDVALIARHSEKYWQASAWRLERKYPDRWGRQKMEIHNPRGKFKTGRTL